MNPPANQRIAPKGVVLILALLLGVWLVFQFLPEKKPASPTPPVVVTESKLHAVGLADNPDWEGLPELFAVWADQLNWENDKTAFAYWDPWAKSYAYFFEVTRQNGRYRFRLASKEVLRRENVYYQHEEGGPDSEEVPELTAHSDTHPFVFLSKISVKLQTRLVVKPDRGDVGRLQPRVPIDVVAPRITAPKANVEQSGIHDAKKK